MKSFFFYLTIFGFLLAVVARSLYSFPSEALLLGGVCVGILLVARLLTGRREYLYIGIIFIAVVVGIMRTSFVPVALPRLFVPLIDTRSVLEGVVVEAPDIRESGVRLTVEIEKEGVSTRVLAVVPIRGNFHTGDTVSISGILKSPKPFETDGGRIFDYPHFLAKEKVFAIMQPASVHVIGRDSGVWLNILRFLEKVKNVFVHALETALPEPSSALATGLLSGGKQGLGKSLIEAFTISGLLQIIVLSGYNVMIVAQAILRSLWFLPRRTSFLFASGGIVLFILAAGAGSSAVRAGVMGVFALLARSSGRTYEVLRALLIALVLMLFWNPLLLVYDPGLQFSVMATLGIIIGTPLASLRLLWIRSSTMREIVATSICAQLFVLPILLWHTGNLSLISLFATVLVMPVIPVAMALSFIAGVVTLVFGSFVPSIALVAGLPAYIVLSYVIEVAKVSSVLPLARILVPEFPFYIVLLLYAFLAWMVVRMQKETSRARHNLKRERVSTQSQKVNDALRHPN